MNCTELNEAIRCFTSKELRDEIKQERCTTCKYTKFCDDLVDLFIKYMRK